MQFTPSALFAPRDQVMAVHRRSRDAHDAVALLTRAGFDGRSLAIVGSRCPFAADTASAGGWRNGLERWSRDGLAWGLLWIATGAVAARALPANAATLAVMLLAGAALALAHAAFVAWRVAPAAEPSAAWHRPGRSYGSHDADLAAGRLLVVVRGSRGELALARDVLAHAGSEALADADRQQPGVDLEGADLRA